MKSHPSGNSAITYLLLSAKKEKAAIEKDQAFHLERADKALAESERLASSPNEELAQWHQSRHRYHSDMAQTCKRKSQACDEYIRALSLTAKSKPDRAQASSPVRLHLAQTAPLPESKKSYPTAPSHLRHISPSLPLKTTPRPRVKLQKKQSQTEAKPTDPSLLAKWCKRFRYLPEEKVRELLTTNKVTTPPPPSRATPTFQTMSPTKRNLSAVFYKASSPSPKPIHSPSTTTLGRPPFR